MSSIQIPIIAWAGAYMAHSIVNYRRVREIQRGLNGELGWPATKIQRHWDELQRTLLRRQRTILFSLAKAIGMLLLAWGAGA